MPLPPELDQKIRTRFGQLIKEADSLGGGRHLKPAHEAFFTKALSLTNTLFGVSVRGREIEKRINQHIGWSVNGWDAVSHIGGMLEGLKDDYENGFLDDLEKRVVANISADYMTQVEGLFSEGKSGENDHVPAAVLCGAVLEDALRRLCDRQDPTVATDKPNGRPKALNDLIQDLQKADAFNKAKAQQLRGWAQIRNSAAHGKFKEFNRDDVDLMIKGVTNFLADNL